MLFAGLPSPAPTVLECSSELGDSSDESESILPSSKVSPRTVSAHKRRLSDVDDHEHRPAKRPHVDFSTTRPLGHLPFETPKIWEGDFSDFSDWNDDFFPQAIDFSAGFPSPVSAVSTLDNIDHLDVSVHQYDFSSYMGEIGSYRGHDLGAHIVPVEF